MSKTIGFQKYRSLLQKSSTKETCILQRDLQFTSLTSTIVLGFPYTRCTEIALANGQGIVACLPFPVNSHSIPIPSKFLEGEGG